MRFLRRILAIWLTRLSLRVEHWALSYDVEAAERESDRLYERMMRNTDPRKRQLIDSLAEEVVTRLQEDARVERAGEVG